MELSPPSPNTLPDKPNPPPTAEPARDAMFVGGIWLIVLAAILLICGLCAGTLYLIVPLTAPNAEDGIQTNIVLGSLAGFGLLFGAVLVWQGVNAMRGRASMPAARAFPPLLVLALAFIGAILLGIGALAFQPLAAYAFPPWHFLAASLPPLALLAYGARRLGRASGLRALVVSFGWGAIVGTSVAFLLEALVALGFVIIVAVILASLPNAQALAEQLRLQLLQAQRTRDFSAIAEWLAHPAVIGGVLLYLAVIVPAVEEAFKALVVAFVDPRRTRASDAVLWGMSAGAGFAVIESILNASVMVTLWAPLVLSRIGASILHVANGAAMGRGWYAARVERRWRLLFIAYVLSVLFHAVWNGAAVVVSSQAIGLAGGSPRPTEAALVGGMILLLVLLAFAGLAWIVYIVRRERPHQEQTQ